MPKKPDHRLKIGKRCAFWRGLGNERLAFKLSLKCQGGSEMREKGILWVLLKSI